MPDEPHKVSALESWTSHKSLAKKWYANFPGAEIITLKFPIESILCAHRAKGNWRQGRKGQEFEFVVVGRMM